MPETLSTYSDVIQPRKNGVHVKNGVHMQGDTVRTEILVPENASPELIQNLEKSLVAHKMREAVRRLHELLDSSAVDSQTTPYKKDSPTWEEPGRLLNQLDGYMQKARSLKMPIEDIKDERDALGALNAAAAREKPNDKSVDYDEAKGW